jgi:hypothetical protein
MCLICYCLYSQKLEQQCKHLQPVSERFQSILANTVPVNTGKLMKIIYYLFNELPFINTPKNLVVRFALPTSN